MAFVGLRHRETFMLNYIQPLLEDDLLEMTIPDKPRSSKQKYKTTSNGLEKLRSTEFPQSR